jgi:hypothetical protein
MRRRAYSIAIVTVALSIPALAMVPAANAGAGAAGFAGPAREVVAHPANPSRLAQFTSRNWDGYITYATNHGTDFNRVAATWVQPTVTCEVAKAWTVFWVGLDGWWNDTVEQGGSSARCGAANHAPTYALWWEMFPTNSIQTVLTINAGDTINASVVYVPGTAKFTITVTDQTTGQSFTKHERCATGLSCDRSSADVITEDVGASGGTFFPLADYATMSYSAARVTDTSGHAGSISAKQWTDAAVTESSKGVTYATVSPLTAHGSAFETTWQHQ